jgi:hypothetical protein
MTSGSRAGPCQVAIGRLASPLADPQITSLTRSDRCACPYAGPHNTTLAATELCRRSAARCGASSHKHRPRRRASRRLRLMAKRWSRRRALLRSQPALPTLCARCTLRACYMPATRPCCWRRAAPRCCTPRCACAAPTSTCRCVCAALALCMAGVPHDACQRVVQTARERRGGARVAAGVA